MKRNLFIVLEGIDGSGKSTQVKLLAAQLQKAGHSVYTTFEPTDGPVGSVLRRIFKHEIDADHRTIAALFAADRLDHLLNKTSGLLKKLEDGFTVISDRYYFSSYAYHGTHMPMDWVIELNSMTAALLRPDLNIYIDISAENSIKRINKGRGSVELYETTENLNNVREKYFEAFERLRNAEKIAIIDGDNSEELIARAIWNEVEKLTNQQEVMQQISGKGKTLD